MPGFPCSPFREVFLLRARNSDLVLGMLHSGRKGRGLPVSPGQAEGHNLRKAPRNKIVLSGEHNGCLASERPSASLTGLEARQRYGDGN